MRNATTRGRVHRATQSRFAAAHGVRGNDDNNGGTRGCSPRAACRCKRVRCSRPAAALAFRPSSGCGTLPPGGLRYGGYATILPRPHEHRASAMGRAMQGGSMVRQKRPRTPRTARKEADGPARRPLRAEWPTTVPVGEVRRPAGSDTQRGHPSAPVMQPGASLRTSTAYGGNPKRHGAGSRSPWAFRLPRIPDPAYRLRESPFHALG